MIASPLVIRKIKLLNSLSQSFNADVQKQLSTTQTEGQGQMVILQNHGFLSPVYLCLRYVYDLLFVFIGPENSTIL